MTSYLHVETYQFWYSLSRDPYLRHRPARQLQEGKEVRHGRLTSFPEASTSRYP